MLIELAIAAFISSYVIGDNYEDQTEEDSE